MPDKEVTILDDNNYAARIAAAKQKQVPVGGAPMPHIPPLDQPPAVQAAHMARNLTPEQVADLKNRGQFIPGVGSGLSINQPGLRQQAQAPAPQPVDPGVINPPRQGGPVLRPETEQQLREFEKAKAEPDKSEKEENKKITKEIEEIEGEFDFDEFGNRVRNLLVNKDRRDIIESRCTPMKLEDLLLQQEVQQVVPIAPNRFEPTFRSISGAEDLFIKRSMVGERGETRYVLDKFSLMNLCCGLYALNGKPMPSHLDANGDPDEKLFEKKFKLILKYPISLLVDLSVNYGWFERRVRKLLVVDEIKGF
jgi:hypothetical protein